MKFKVKSKPYFWDKKTVIHFAWFPTRIDDTIIWLERYVSISTFNITDAVTYGYNNGYNQCKKDMADKYNALLNKQE